MSQLSAPAVLALALLSCTLGGCGGGGGGSGSSSPSVSPASIALLPVTQDRTFGTYSINGSYNPSPTPAQMYRATTVNSSNAVQITLSPSTGAGAPYAIRILANDAALGLHTERIYDANPASGTALSWPHGNVRTTMGQFQSSGPFRTIGYIQANDLQASSAFSYQLFGYWLNEKADRIQDFGYFSAGATTSIGAIPTSGQAMYRGHFIGTTSTDLNSAPLGRAASANVSADVNFSGRTIQFSTTDTQVTNSSGVWAADSSWNINGILTWNSGSNSFSGAVAAPGQSATGEAAGRFYGPNANELGGVLRAATSNGIRGIEGAFGAAK